MTEEVELGVVEYLRDLSDRLMHVPATYGIDGFDIDNLNQIATTLEKLLEAVQQQSKNVVTTSP